MSYLLANSRHCLDWVALLMSFVGNEVVEDDGDVLFVEHAVEARLFELVDGDGGSDVIAQHDVELGVDELACLDLGEACVCGQNFSASGSFPWFILLLILSQNSLYLLLIALTSAWIPATIISVSVPAPQVTMPSPHARPT